MRSRKHKVGRVMRPAVFGAAAFLAAIGVVTVVSLCARSVPRVGDIIAFDSARDVPPDHDARLLVHRPNQFACVLDLSTLKRTGGSLIVEARMSGDARAIRVHWAGGRTSADAADCGETADLIVDRRDIDLLAVAAGGYGIRRGSASVFTSSVPF